MRTIKQLIESESSLSEIMDKIVLEDEGQEHIQLSAVGEASSEGFVKLIKSSEFGVNYLGAEGNNHYFNFSAGARMGKLDTLLKKNRIRFRTSQGGKTFNGSKVGMTVVIKESVSYKKSLKENSGFEKGTRVAVLGGGKEKGVIADIIYVLKLDNKKTVKLKYGKFINDEQ